MCNIENYDWWNIMLSSVDMFCRFPVCLHHLPVSFLSGPGRHAFLLRLFREADMFFSCILRHVRWVHCSWVGFNVRQRAQDLWECCKSGRVCWPSLGNRHLTGSGSRMLKTMLKRICMVLLVYSYFSRVFLLLVLLATWCNMLLCNTLLVLQSAVKIEAQKSAL